jgi:hypothetical protein
MKLRSPAWIIIAGAVLVQSSGVLSTAGSALIGIDNAIRATIDLKALVAKIVPPAKIVPIKPVVVPPIKKVERHAPRKVATK